MTLWFDGLTTSGFYALTLRQAQGKRLSKDTSLKVLSTHNK